MRCPEVLTSIGVTLKDLEGMWYESKRTFYSPEDPKMCNVLSIKRCERYFIMDISFLNTINSLLIVYVKARLFEPSFFSITCLKLRVDKKATQFRILFSKNV